MRNKTRTNKTANQDQYSAAQRHVLVALSQAIQAARALLALPQEGSPEDWAGVRDDVQPTLWNLQIAYHLVDSTYSPPVEVEARDAVLIRFNNVL